MLLGSLVLGAPAANANGSVYRSCTSTLTVSGYSAAGYGANTSAPSNTNPSQGCGDARVRAFYRITSGGPLYYAAWKQAYGFVESKPGNIIQGGNHNCTYVAPIYSGNFPFST